MRIRYIMSILILYIPTFGYAEPPKARSPGEKNSQPHQYVKVEATHGQIEALLEKNNVEALATILKMPDSFDVLDQLTRWGANNKVRGLIEVKGRLKIENPNSDQFEIKIRFADIMSLNGFDVFFFADVKKQIDRDTAQRLHALQGTDCRFVVSLVEKDFEFVRSSWDPFKKGKTHITWLAQPVEQPMVLFSLNSIYSIHKFGSMTILSVKRDKDEQGLWVDIIAPTVPESLQMDKAAAAATSQPAARSIWDSNREKAAVENLTTRLELSKWKQVDTEKQAGRASSLELTQNTSPHSDSDRETTPEERMWGDVKSKALTRKRNLEAQLEAEKAIQAAVETELKTKSRQQLEMAENYVRAGAKSQARKVLNDMIEMYPRESEPYQKAKRLFDSL